MRTSLLSVLIVLLHAASAAADSPVEPGSQVMFFLPESGKFVSSKVYERDEHGVARVADHVYGVHTHGNVYHRVHEKYLIREVPSMNGFSRGQIACLRSDSADGKAGTDVEISHVFANGKAEVEFGDFFGKRFFVFYRLGILDLSQLKSCDADSSPSVTEAKEKPATSFGSAAGPVESGSGSQGR